MKQSAKKSPEKNGKGSNSGQELITADQEQALAPPDFIKIEKNLSSLGFFTPSSKKIRNAKAGSHEKVMLQG